VPDAVTGVAGVVGDAAAANPAPPRDRAHTATVPTIIFPMDPLECPMSCYLLVVTGVPGT
jgi:hypothetical protein